MNPMLNLLVDTDGCVGWRGGVVCLSSLVVKAMVATRSDNPEQSVKERVDGKVWGGVNGNGDNDGMRRVTDGVGATRGEGAVKGRKRERKIGGGVYSACATLKNPLRSAAWQQTPVMKMSDR